MRIASRWIFIGWMLAAAAGWSAPSAAEQRAARDLSAAEQSFSLGLWERAERQFAVFAEKYPKSDDRAQAVLRQAQARFKQGKFTNAVELLAIRQRDAGRLADEYQFWLGESQFGASNYTAAADAYAKLAHDFTNSPHVLEAGYDAALARSKLGDWPQVNDLLRQPDGVFQLAAARNPTNEFVVRGKLLLGEAQFSQNDLRAAEETLQPLAGQKLGVDLDWQRQYLLCRIQLAGDRATEALQTASNLTALASVRRDLAADTAMLRGEILERLKMFDEAVAAYESNLASDLPTDRRRQAVLKIVELLLARNRVAAAAQQLDNFLGEYSRDTVVDTALLTAGELHLKEHLAAGDTYSVDLTITNAPKVFPAYTNDLKQAYAQFDWIVRNFPRSPSLGKAMLDRAWCLWLAGQMAEAGQAFQQAAGRLPVSVDQATARFKWADAQMRLGDFAGALTNYQAVLGNYAMLPTVQSELVEPALYQIVRASLENNDLAVATNALDRLLAAYPESFLCDRGMLLTGEKLNRTGSPAKAREIFNLALSRLVNPPLAPEIRLAVAQTFEQEKDWTAAIAEYDRWLVIFAGNETQPQVEYARAWDIARSGQSATALAAFTRFVTQHPSNELALLAQNWAADYYLEQGDFKNAEANYQLLFQKWPPSALTYSARLMAGRAAMARLGYADATNYFLALINNTKDCPPDYVAQAFFEYGDATTRMESTDTNSPLTNFWSAIGIFSKIPQLYPTNDLVPPAWGRIGDCFLQLGAQDFNRYTNAINAYQKVLDAPRANVSARSQAEIGLGIVLEKQAAQKPADDQSALLRQALDHYLNVALATNLRGQESPDAFWVGKAGMEAARLAETLGEWRQAVNLYQMLEDKLPPLKAMLEKKIAKAQEKLAAKNSP